MFTTGKVLRLTGTTMLVVSVPIAVAVLINHVRGTGDVDHVLFVYSMSNPAYQQLRDVFTQAENDYAGTDHASVFETAGRMLELVYKNGHLEAHVIRGANGMRPYDFPMDDYAKDGATVNVDYYSQEAQLAELRFWHSRSLADVAAACLDLVAKPDAEISPALRGQIAKLNLELGESRVGTMPLKLCQKFAMGALENFSRYNHPVMLDLVNGIAEDHPELVMEIAAVRDATPVFARIMENGRATAADAEIYAHYAQAVTVLEAQRLGLFLGKDEARTFSLAANGVHALQDVVQWAVVIDVKASVGNGLNS